MCIAIYTPAGKILSRSTLQACFTNNPDGAGLVYINTDYCGVRRMKIHKYMDFSSFYQKYQRAVQTSPDSPMLLHFRIGTHGVKTTFNCHPFWIKKGKLAFIHNGIISGVGFCKEKSDTQLFNDKVLKQLPKDFEYNEAIVTLIEEFVSTSKLITLNIKGDATIFNENKGSWVEDVWFSNDSYKPKAVYPISTYRASSYKGKFHWEIDQYSLEPCEYCSLSKQLLRMSVYSVDKETDPMVVCPKCEAELLKTGTINKDQRMKMTDYISEENAKRKVQRIADARTFENDYSGYGMYN